MSQVFDLQSKFSATPAQQAAVDALCAGITDEQRKLTLQGVTGAGKTFTIANVIAKLGKPALIMAPNKTLAAQFYAEMRDFFPNNAVEYFVSYYDYYQPEAYVPSTGTFIEKDASINEQVEQMRLSATKAILERPDVIIVGSVSAIYGLGDPEAYMSMVCHLKCGERYPQHDLLRKFVSMQYKRNDVELSRGTYRVRGDVIDIFPADSEKYALRILMFDDEVERMTTIDPLTGQLIEDLPRTTIFPKSHYVTPRQTVLDMIENIKVDLRKRLAQLESANKLVEAQRLAERVRYDIEMMVELGYCQGIENYSFYLSKRELGDPPVTLMNYLPKDALLILDESHVTVPQIGAMYKGDRARKETLVEYGFRLPTALENRPLKYDEFEEIAPTTVYVSATPGDYELKESASTTPLLVRPTGLLDPAVDIRPVSTQVDDLLGEIRERAAQGDRILVTTLTKRMAEDLTTYYQEHGVRVRYLHSDVSTMDRVEILRDLRLGQFDVLVGINLLREGLDLPEVSLVAILDADKEGFLRSERSLIQTMGRAARHINGKAILYADTVTGSMRRALNTIESRRDIQKAYNEQHGITPQSVKRAVNELLETPKAAEDDETIKTEAQLAIMTPAEMSKAIRQKQKKMRQHAENLEFEAAAQVRDEIKQLKDSALHNQHY